MMGADSRSVPERSPFSFDGCPSCGADIHYPTKGFAECPDCGDEFVHEIRSNRHLLWSWEGSDGMGEVVNSAEKAENRAGEKDE